MDWAQAERCAFVELGGWAIAAEWRATKAALYTLLGRVLNSGISLLEDK
jgi:hypothetical protein